MPLSLKELTQKRAELYGANKALLDRAEGESRQLNTEEAAEYDARDKEIDSLCDQVDRITAHETRKNRLSVLQAQLDKPLPRQTAPTVPSGPDKPLGGDGAALSDRIEYMLGRAKVLRLGKDSDAGLLSRARPDYQGSFLAYLSGRPFDQLALQVGNDPKGGYLAPTAMAAGIIKFLDDAVTLRQLGTVLTPLAQAVSLGAVSYDTDVGDADWTAEIPASDIAEDDAARFGMRELSPNLLTKLIKISMKMLRSSGVIDIESFMTSRIGYKMALTENKAFLTGSGAKQPLGVFTASDQGIPTTRDVTMSSGTAFTSDDLIEALYTLKTAYHNRATWLTSREFVKRCRKLKTGDGQYIWTPGIAGGPPSTILERPYVVDENAPNTFTTGLYIGVVGDFSFYWIVDSLAMEIQRLNELFSLRNLVGLLARKETDAMPVLGEAFVRLKLG